MSRASFVVCGALAVLAGGLRAQDRGHAELQLMQRQLQQSRTETDRLLELRMRQDLGLPVDERDDRTFRSTGPVTTEQREKLEQERVDEESAVSVLNVEYEKLRNAVEQLRAAAEARLKIDAADQPLAVVPQAGMPVPGTPGSGALPSSEMGQPVPGTGRSAGGRPPVDASTVGLTAALDPIVTQIHGSTDHQRVAQALFRAGQELMRVAQVARSQGQPAIGKELDDRGREKLQRAIDELAPLLAEKEPPFAALFYLGRSRELLFRWSERHENLNPTASARDFMRREQEVREPFLAITARDVVKGARAGVEELGPWGRAAQTAMTNFTWTNQHAAYDALPSIKALTWPGER